MKLILQAIKALFRKIEASIDSAQTTANNAQDTANNAQTTANNAQTTAHSAQATADNAQTTANSAQATADNAQTTADSKMSATNPVGSGAFSMGRKSGSKVGRDSHAEGFVTTAEGVYSHAEGYTTTASGGYSHAECAYTTASGDYSHAEGRSAEASGDYSHAEGYATTASENSSHAEGYYTTARGLYSHAEGYYTTARCRSQHVYGEYNINDPFVSHYDLGKYVQIVGNGTYSKPSNAHTLDWSGNAWYAGDVYVGSTSGTNKDAGSKKLATEEYVDNKVSDFGGIQSPTTAEVGQTIVVKAVDENGKPTEWEAADMASGGGDNWKLLVDFESTEEIAANTGMIFDTADDGTPINAKEIIIDWYCPSASQSAYATFKVNDVGCTGYAMSKPDYFWSGVLLTSSVSSAALHFRPLTDVCLLTLNKLGTNIEPVWFAKSGAFKAITSLQLTMFGGTYPVGLKIKILGR